MKSLNVKKIATAAAGAALLGAAFAGAVQVDSSGLGNFNFFASGSPQVKIVVGAKAAPSDAVAAANIAAMIGNLAYTSEDITVVGTDLLSCSGGTVASTGTTTTTASSDDKVTLEVTTPGVNPNVAYQMKTFIEGFLDATVVDDKADSMSGAVILATSSPFASGGRKVTATETALAFKGTVTDSQVSKSYTEEERYFLYAKSQYDTSSKKVKAKGPQVAYEAQFTNPIQVCTEFTPDDNTCSDTYKTAKHRMKIKLLGTDWVIYSMDNFNTDGTIGATTVVTLGKEIQFKEFMQIGDEVTAPNGVKVKLKDISAVPTTQLQLLTVAFEIYDKDGKLLKAPTLQQDQEFNDYGTVIRVSQVFAGLGQTSYAQVSIFSDKLSLQQSSVVNTDNQNWRVNLVGGGSAYGSSLARIQLTRQVIDDMNAGDTVTFLQKPQLLKLTYTGLADITYDTLSFSSGERSFPTSTSDTTTIGQSYVRVTSGLTSPFDFGTTSTNVFYYDTDSVAAGTSTQGVVFYQDSTTGNFVPYMHASATGNITYAATITSLGIAEATSQSSIRIWNGTTGAAAQCTSVLAPQGGAGPTNGSILLASNSSYASTSLDVNIARTFTAGTPSTAGYALSSFSGNLSVLASSVNSGCASGVFTYDFQTSNATLTPGLGTTGVTYGLGNNYVKYTYGSTSVNLRFNTPGITAAGDPTGDYVIWIPEYQKDDDTTLGAFALDIASGDTSSPRLGPGSGVATGGYNSSYATTSVAASAFEAGYISPRGSKLDSISLTAAAIKYATTLAPALYTLSSAGVDTTANKATKSYKAGETALDSAGYKVVVKDITAKGTTTTTTGTGGTGATTGGKVEGLDQLKPSSDKAFVVKPLNTADSPLVVTDVQASSTQPLIVVGGPLVNTVAAQALAGAPAATASMEPVVKVQGDKILVYGYTAADTQAAANELISFLRNNADTITGR